MFKFFVRRQNRQSFQPTVCFICAKKATDCALKTCSGCKLLVYCSPAHQASHWPRHRRFCRSIRAVAVKLNCSYLFETPFESESLWKRYRVAILLGVRKELGAPLSAVEEQIIITPNCCVVCHKYEKSMTTCRECCSVWYCSDGHSTQDAAQHKDLCDEFSVSLKLHIDNYTTSDENLSRGYIVTDFNKFTDCSESFIDSLVRLETYSTYLGEKLSKISFSDSFTYQLTTIHALKQCGLISKRRDLVIHIVGAQDMEVSSINLWSYLFPTFQDNFDEILIVLIGPRLNSELCSVPCNTEPFGFKLKVRNVYYHTFYREDNVKSRPPDLIIAFNCGFHEYVESKIENDTWKESIPYFCKHSNTGIVFTSYTKSEAERDFNYFIANCECKDLVILEKHVHNPFRSLKPNYDWEESHNSAFFYFNNFISIIKTK